MRASALHFSPSPSVTCRSGLRMSAVCQVRAPRDSERSENHPGSDGGETLLLKGKADVIASSLVRTGMCGHVIEQEREREGGKETDRQTERERVCV